MARPKKDKNLRHTRHIMLRLTNTEYEIIAENAKAASLPLAEYVRKQITNKKVIVKYEIVADLPELKKLIAEFGKIGSNLNQIARYFNTGGLHSQEMRNEIKKSITEIYKLKYEVIKLAGDFITVNANNRNSAGLPWDACGRIPARAARLRGFPPGRSCSRNGRDGRKAR